MSCYLEVEKESWTVNLDQSLDTEDVDFAWPISYGKGLVHFRYCHTNEIVSLI